MMLLSITLPPAIILSSIKRLVFVYGHMPAKECIMGAQTKWSDFMKMAISFLAGQPLRIEGDDFWLSGK